MPHGTYDRRHTREWLDAKRKRASRVALATAQARSDQRVTDTSLRLYQNAKRGPRYYSDEQDS